jgi:hypothetical protein
MLTSLRTLRQLVGDKTGDVLVLKATHDSENVSSFRDITHLADRGDRAPSIVTKLIYFSDGQELNKGHEAAVQDYASYTRTLTFQPDAPVPPVVGDVAELWSVSERIGSIGALTRLINYSILQVADLAATEVYAPDQTFSARLGTLPIPAEWAEFGGGDWTETNGYVRQLRSRWLRVNPGRRTVQIWGAAADQANNRAVALFGYPRCQPLLSDDDATEVDAQWIVESVAEAVTLARSWTGADAAAAERRANFWASRSATYRRDVASPRRGLGIALP